MNMDNKYVMDRLTRLESRLVEGFAQLGANVTHKPDPNTPRVRVDAHMYKVYIADQSVSIGEILRHIENGTFDRYDVYVGGNYMCDIGLGETND